MNFPKRYGESRIDQCPFCHKQAISENDQGFPVCNDHKSSLIPELKCLCGEYLMFQRGKFGMFFSCIKCGNMNLKKALEINNIPSLSSASKPMVFEPKKTPGERKEITITSNDLEYFD